MRIKSVQQQYFDFSFESTLKVVSEYREKHNLISQLLDENPQLVACSPKFDPSLVRG